MSDGQKAAIHPKTKRRIPTMALGLLMVIGGGLGFGLWSSAQSERNPVLVAAHDLNPGDVIERNDLRVALVAVEPGTPTTPESSLSTLVGSTVRTPVTAGSLIDTHMFGQDSEILPQGMALVGATLDVGRYPSSGLAHGDQVVVIYTDADGGSVVGEAELFAVQRLNDSSAGDLFVTLLVPQGPVVLAVANAAAASDLTLAKVAS